MTRDEAKILIAKSTNLVDSLIALGLLKVDEPITTTERALFAINAAIGDPRCKFRDGQHLLNVLGTVGVRLTDNK